MIDYENRLDGHETVESLLDEAESIAEAFAREHFEECYDTTQQCAACATENPVLLPTGPWVEKRLVFRQFIETVEEHVDSLGGDITEHNEVLDEDLRWVGGELRGTYFEAFEMATAVPEDCVVCNKEVIRDDEPCGHEIESEPCPVQ